MGVAAVRASKKVDSACAKIATGNLAPVTRVWMDDTNPTVAFHVGQGVLEERAMEKMEAATVWTTGQGLDVINVRVAGMDHTASTSAAWDVRTRHVATLMAAVRADPTGLGISVIAV